jgi:DNA-binding MarR family transcriptional regulator
MITEETIRELFIVTCFYGKRITDLMPRLPKRLKPRHINVIEIIHRLNLQSGYVRVSDVCNELGITAPSVTKLINELEEYKVVTKLASEDDKRITTVNLTRLGEKYYNIFVKQYHSKLVEFLDKLEEKDCATTMKTMEYIYQTMVKNPIELDRSELTSDSVSRGRK